MIVASGIAMQFGAKPLFSDVSVKFGWFLDCRAQQVSRDAYFLTANTPLPFSFAVKPACCSRFATSLGTFRPLVSLFGVPV